MKQSRNLYRRTRMPVVFLVDRSPTAAEHAKEFLWTIEGFKSAALAHPVLSRLVELSVIGTGPFEVLHRFKPVYRRLPETFGLGARQPISEALMNTLDVIDTRRKELEDRGVEGVRRPLILLLSDGRSNSVTGSAMKRLDDASVENRAGCFAMAPFACRHDDLAYWATTGRGWCFRNRKHWLRVIDLHLRTERNPFLGGCKA